MSYANVRQQFSISSVSVVHQIADAARVQMPRNVRVVQRKSVLAETAAIPPSGGCLKREIRGRISRQNGGQEEKAHQEAESSESRLQAAQQNGPGVSRGVARLLRA